MSWVSDYQYTFIQKIAFQALQLSGHIPHHIAFVMDGNRRFARSKQLDKIEGHSRGFSKLADVLRWCLDMGIREVTTFAFSIENFKRSNEEVEGLFNLARDKFSKLLEEASRLDEHGIRIRVIGNLLLLPADLQRLIATAMLRTERNDKLFLNVAFAYTSRDEITQAVEAVLRDDEQADDPLQPTDINERLLEACLYTRHSSPPDLVFRTSGETRLSDFMMWQLSTSVLYFTDVLWPQITIWNFLASIVAYQRDRCRLEDYRRVERLHSVQLAKSSEFYSLRVQKFLLKLDANRRKLLIALASN
ncbi:dehydrodolichyl diphosphate synthase complex subunit DHDDS [Drosophila novamexicana]|uniref:dehydrodolichyl diphosphate synthase complex subunit DHDDS n=1 Tax=Drosophila novamexicana TaxID=47314 RepID=UPI0011E5EAC1|nr:dehydrodolichyl diphosphate synthase complex subunit DHDDS [Drosophila novamexicana]